MASVKRRPIVQRISAEGVCLTVGDLETSKIRQPRIDSVSCVTKKMVSIAVFFCTLNIPVGVTIITSINIFQSQPTYTSRSILLLGA